MVGRLASVPPTFHWSALRPRANSVRLHLSQTLHVSAHHCQVLSSCKTVLLYVDSHHLQYLNVQHLRVFNHSHCIRIRAGINSNDLLLPRTAATSQVCLPVICFAEQIPSLCWQTGHLLTWRNDSKKSEYVAIYLSRNDNRLCRQLTELYCALSTIIVLDDIALQDPLS